MMIYKESWTCWNYNTLCHLADDLSATPQHISYRIYPKGLSNHAQLRPLRWALLFMLMFGAFSLAAQNDGAVSDTTTAAQSPPGASGFKQKWNMQPHSPLKATIYAAVLPGSGQAYNKKYWKMPIVYAGLGTCVGFIIYNTDKYRYFKGQYIAQIDGDPSTNPDVNASNLDAIQEQYRRWLDVSYMALFGVYIFQIIDANVDGHLFYYNIDKDLSLQMQPCLMPVGNIKPGIGLTLKF